MRRDGGRDRRVLTAVLVALLCATTACAVASKSRLSAPAQQALRINTVLLDLAERLGQHDASRVAALFTPALAGDAALREGLRSLMAAPELRAQFTVERLWLQAHDTVRVDVQWTLRAQPASGQTLATGAARFVFEGKEYPRLAAVSGDNPFFAQLQPPLAP